MDGRIGKRLFNALNDMMNKEEVVSILRTDDPVLLEEAFAAIDEYCEKEGA